MLACFACFTGCDVWMLFRFTFSVGWMIWCGSLFGFFVVGCVCIDWCVGFVAECDFGLVIALVFVD